MTRGALCALILWLVTTGAHAASAGAHGDLPEVTAQGQLRWGGPAEVSTSPSGNLSCAFAARGADGAAILWDAEIRARSGESHRIESIPAASFLLSDRPCLIALARPETNSIPARLRIYDLDGRLLHEREISAPSNPALSSDGGFFACRTPEGILLLDLRDFSGRVLPHADLFAVGDQGTLAGVDIDAGLLRIVAPSGAVRELPWGGFPSRIALPTASGRAYLIDAKSLYEIDLATGAAASVSKAPDGVDYRDLVCAGDRVIVGTRRSAGNRWTGGWTIFDPKERRIETREGASMQIPRAEAPGDLRGIPWPIAPNAQHPVGNTYGEYQYYGGSPYPHPGIDVMGDPGQPVFAVRRGVVKSILTTSGSLHWRVAVGDSAIAATTRGYLYAHLDQSSIAVDVGDVIQQGQYIGDLVEWPIYDFTHCHFTRIEDSGNTWDGNWLSVHNPHLDLTQHSETTPPVFEPARGSDLLAFCNNQTSTYQSPNLIHGAVDIIAHVGDRIVSDWVCTVQELRYTIYPLGMPGSPIVNDKLSQHFDMTCDTYGSGQIDAFLISLLYKDDSTCNTQGDYDFREFFHILTNSDGDGVYEQSDLNEAWNTAALPDRSYVVKVVAIDAVGNATADSMIVTTANGNPSGLVEAAAAAPRLVLESIGPNPSSGGVTARFRIGAADRILAAIYDPAGRRVRLLQQGEIADGSHPLRWDGRDDAGREVATGTYFIRILGMRSGVEEGKFLLVR